jgi:hypothetical protein
VNETPFETVSVPLPIRDSQSLKQLVFSFVSGRTEHTVAVEVDPLSLSSGGGGESCPLASWHPGDEEAIASYYAGIFKDPDEDELYSSLLSQLRKIRRMERLNDDEYLETMVQFVQQIPYDPDAPLCPRTPAQVLLDGKGDCDEKSLLLLGLLYREGYDAAILLFPGKHHATAGIRIDVNTQPSMRVFDSMGRKYLYIETTRSSFIGLYPDEYENENPVIIPTRNGTIRYDAVNEVLHIISTQKRMEEKMRWINETGTAMLGEIESLETKLNSYEYPDQQDFDTDYTRYAGLTTQYNVYVDEFRQINEVYKYITDHQFDREGVCERIANSKVENLL